MRHNRMVTQTASPSPASPPPSSLPTISFSQRTLSNGLRVIVAPDHLAPVVAINIWYVVGSRHEQPGRTGFAHLFEHFMFQGSRHVEKGEHFSLIQGAGGVNNATTFFDRTNYFETLPVAPARAGAVARGRPHGDAARRARPGEPRQPARGGQEREAPDLRQPAVRLVLREAAGRRLSLPTTPTATRRSGRWRT